MAALTFEGGLNQQDVTLVKPQECINGYNFELGVNDTHYRPRKPFDHLGGTNLLLYSEQFDNAQYIKTNSSISANAATDPLSTSTADKLIEDGTTDQHYVFQGTPTITSGSVYTASVYVKAAERTQCYFLISLALDNYGFYFNLSTGAVISTAVNGTTFSNNSYTTEDIGSGWYRLSITSTVTDTSFNLVVMTASAGASSYAGDGSSGIYVWGAKANYGSSKGEYVKTTTTRITGSTSGFIQLIKNDNTETTLVQLGAEVFSWDGDITYTDVGTVTATSKLRGTTWSLGGYSVITDIEKLTVVKKWDGTTFSTLTTGLGADLYAKYGIVHLGRMWLFNVKAGTDTPHLMVASLYEDPTSYDTSKRAQSSTFSTGNEAFYMTTPDLLPINGVALFFGTLIISTENGRIWKLTGTDSTDFQWLPFYSGSSAVGTETMANIGNDIVYMRRGGNIESLVSVQDYGDVKSDDLSRWIRDITSGFTDAITVYDQERQKVYFFNDSGSVPVLFKDMQPTDKSPWSVYKTSHSSNLDTSAAIYMRQPGGTSWYVYFGDSNGNIYQMDGTGTGDNGDTDIVTYRRTMLIEGLDGYDPNFNQLTGRVHYRMVADCDLVMDFEWGDDYSITRCTVPLEGPPVGDASTYFGGTSYFGGAFYFNTGFFYSERISTKGFSPVGRGEGVYIDLSVTSSQRFDITKIQV